MWRPLFELAGLVGFDFQWFGQIAVVGFGLASLRGFPDHVVAIGRHDFQDLQFPLHHVEVRLPIDKLQTRTTSEDAVAVGGSVDVVPDMVLGEHGFADGFELLARSGWVHHV